MRRLLLVPVALALVLAGPLTAAHARPAAPTVGLKASPTTVLYGRSVTFSGKIRPPSGGQAVDILDENGHTLASTTTNADGTYKVSAKPHHNLTAHADWAGTSSSPVRVHVRPRLGAQRSPIRLFDTTTVTGRIVPSWAGRSVNVMVAQGGHTYDHVVAKIGNAGHFTAQVPIDHLGSQQIVVAFHGKNFARASWRSNPGTPSTPGLGQGSHGAFVEALQRRLIQLHYHTAGVNGDFDYRLADAVMAFHKVQGMSRTTYVDDATWKALTAPRTLVKHVTTVKPHWEVNLTKQVAFYLVDNKVDQIFHISSGKPSTPTRPGQFRVYQKQPGYNQKMMYYSSFFDGNRGLHGYSSVPSYAASHGCVRMPIWSAKWVYNHAPYGIMVDIYF